MHDLTPDQRRGIRESRKKFIEICKLTVQAAAAKIKMVNIWDADGAVGKPPADREAAVVQLLFALRSQLLADWGVKVPERWLQIIYNQPPEPED